MKQIRVLLTLTPGELDELKEMSEKTKAKKSTTAKMAFKYGMIALKTAFDPGMVSYFEVQERIMNETRKTTKEFDKTG